MQGATGCRQITPSNGDRRLFVHRALFVINVVATAVYYTACEMTGAQPWTAGRMAHQDGAVSSTASGTSGRQIKFNASGRCGDRIALTATTPNPAAHRPDELGHRGIGTHRRYRRGRRVHDNDDGRGHRRSEYNELSGIGVEAMTGFISIPTSTCASSPRLWPGSVWRRQLSARGQPRCSARCASPTDRQRSGDGGAFGWPPGVSTRVVMA